MRYVLEGSVLPSGNQVRVNAQLIDADSDAHLWADQFDTPRADLLKMQDEIVAHLAHAMDIQLPEAEAALLKRTPAANIDAEDLALRCESAVQKGGYIGKDADAASRLCQQALVTDPSNVRALTWLAVKAFLLSRCPSAIADRRADLERADELVSRAFALDSNYARAYSLKGGLLKISGSYRRIDRRVRTCSFPLPRQGDRLCWPRLDHLYLFQF